MDNSITLDKGYCVYHDPETLTIFAYCADSRYFALLESLLKEQHSYIIITDDIVRAKTMLKYEDWHKALDAAYPKK